jgi:hypothetical protein
MNALPSFILWGSVIMLMDPPFVAGAYWVEP